MNESERLKQLIEQYKNETETLLAENKVTEAENKTVEIKILKAKLEVQEKLDDVTSQLETISNEVIVKDESISNLTSELDTVKGEKAEMMEKFNGATETIANLNDKVTKMSPIVEQYNAEQYKASLAKANKDYKSSFEKCNALAVFESEEVQSLIKDTIDEDETISAKAKYAISEKIISVFNATDSGLSIKDIQEPSKETKNLNPQVDDFEATYGFKKQ